MSEDSKPAPVHDVHEEEIRQLKDFAQTYGKSLGIAVCAALVIITGVKTWQHHKRSQQQESSQLLVQARSIDDLQDVMTRYDSTPAAPLSLLKLAKVQYDMADYSAALTRYEEFETKYPEHEMVPGARLGRVFCLEASGDTQGALDGFRSFVQTYPDHYLTPQAQLGEGRCLQLLGKREEARTVYEDFIAANPDSAWIGNAKEALDLIEKNAYMPTAEAPEQDLFPPVQDIAPPIMAPQEALPATTEE